ncbi:RnfABCDGE type electron transport complex subunit D [Cognatiyoonia sp. IB215182]|uniref:RnfABCDGE type electron transport complex subunit D n=1 Tax=Cognatiyoonia sp. IB215182 TaxID=3097353 RepID=UPI002A0E3100|nr:RnfABCDGE type electron transport complex subunit D [Cognatiyoonia sp. IB215182]MDX8355426.1 RnfABCDGE type electron transport complex subunit D [Cognatiyoonia sp. IB215182]
MTLQTAMAAPYTHSMFNVSRTMLAVMTCLFPATAHGIFHFGWPALLLFAVTVASAILCELVCLALSGRAVLRFSMDGSALLTGWLVAMTLPPWAPWWIGTLGAAIAVVLGKHVFGGLGQNLFNPAMVARAVLLVALPVHMTTWVAPLPLGERPNLEQALTITFGSDIPADAISGATILSEVQSQLGAGRTLSEIGPDWESLQKQFYGAVPGSLGETSVFLLLLGGLALVLLRIIRLILPLTVLGSLAALSGAAHLVDPEQFVHPAFHLATGSAVFCAFFIATDYVTAPMTALGKAIYGIGIGALIFVIRTWGAFPEGVAFAVLLMNACVPLIDTYTRPRIFGRTRKGTPLPLEER